MGIFKEIPKSDGSGITTFYRISQYRATAEADNDDTTETMFDYNSALNKPSINNVALVGNKTLEDLGIQPADDYALKTEVPTKVSQLENDLDYATEAFVIAQISSAEHFHREIVDVLPDVGKDNVLYLLKKTGKQGDFYDEYLWMNPGYEFIGTTATDLSDYYKKVEVDDLLDKKVDKVAGKELSTNDYTTPEKTKLASLENYNDANLWNAVNALHNYDDTEIKADIAALESQMEGANSEIEVLDEKIEYQITLIRLIRHGDEWIWENTKNDILTFQDAFNQLGNPDVLLCLENVESDGKVYPSYYNAEDDYVRVYYLDKEHAIHLLSVSASDATDTVLGEDVVYQPKVDSVEKLPTIANKGEVRLVGDDDAVYIYDGNKWVPIDKGTSIDLSNYLPKDNTIAFNPTGNYNPATKKYVDDKVGALFIPTKVSQLTNDSQFVGKNTSDLTNYYVKNKLYTRAEVDALIQSGYTLPVATETTLGGVQVGDNLSIDETGKLSAIGPDYHIITETIYADTLTEEGVYLCQGPDSAVIIRSANSTNAKYVVGNIEEGQTFILSYNTETIEYVDTMGEEKTVTSYNNIITVLGGLETLTRYHSRVINRETIDGSYIPTGSPYYAASPYITPENIIGYMPTLPVSIITTSTDIRPTSIKESITVCAVQCSFSHCILDEGTEEEFIIPKGSILFGSLNDQIISKTDCILLTPSGVIYEVTNASVVSVWLKTVSVTKEYVDSIIPKIRKLTQSQYDALEDKDSNTLYCIVD